MTKTNDYGSPAIGCHIDQGNYNPTELSIAIIELAEGLGFPIDAELRKAMESIDEELCEADIIDAGAQEAEDWLNDQETRSHLSWHSNGEAGAFGLWPYVEGAREDCEFVSSKEQEYPADDYRGEWLHVNDHGNATLYVRSENGQDVEVWSVV
jgi:hypothetical protein